MDVNVSFQLDANSEKQMALICKELGVTMDTAYRMFTNAFIRERGFPFRISIREPIESRSIRTADEVTADVEEILVRYASDYERMAR